MSEAQVEGAIILLTKGMTIELSRLPGHTPRASTELVDIF